jgi:hypothetical protein
MEPLDEIVPRKIVLLADFADDLFLVREPDKYQETNIKKAYPEANVKEAYQETNVKEPLDFGYGRRASDPLLPSLIEVALRDGNQIGSQEKVVIPDYRGEFGESLDLKSIRQELISVLDLFPEGSSSRRSTQSTLRVKTQYCVSVNHGVALAASKSFIETWIALLARVDAVAASDLSMLVLYDQNAFVRKALKANNPAAMQLFRNILERVRHGVVVGINGDLNDTDWLEKLTKFMDGQRSKLIVQITADSLRKAGLNISRYTAAEDTIKHILDCTDDNPLKQLLKLTDHLLVVFRETGGLYIDNSGDEMAAWLHYCPNFDRIAQADPKTFGEVPGKFAIFLVALIKEIYRAGHAMDAAPLGSIDAAVRLGAVAYNRLFSQGLGADGGEPVNPFRALEQALSHESLLEIHRNLKEDKQEYKVASLKIELLQNKLAGWRRTDSLLSDPNLEVMFLDIVRNGLDAALKEPEPDHASPANGPDRPWFPPSHLKVPYVPFRQLKLLDHEEIKSFYNLAKVIRKYIETKDWATPLSIAVFGAPGSGKSFAVKQILDTVDPGRKSQPLAFNLAQFHCLDQLTDAFHQIQDQALSSDEVPLAIFDEFDTHFETPYGWLKFFLAPMQDGLFRGTTGEYRVGRAIFLFSGGTSDTYKEFVNGKPETQSKQRTASCPADVGSHQSDATSVARAKKSDAETAAGTATELQRRLSKVIDFTSRLRGYVDIMSINDRNLSTAPSKETRLRRAVLLRSMLESHAKPIFVSYSNGIKRARIDAKVVMAFLAQPQYKHGVRSMEAIIQMSHWIDGEFVPASLPSKEQLEMHVGEEFMNSGSKGKD